MSPQLDRDTGVVIDGSSTDVDLTVIKKSSVQVEKSNKVISLFGGNSAAEIVNLGERSSVVLNAAETAVEVGINTGIELAQVSLANFLVPADDLFPGDDVFPGGELEFLIKPPSSGVSSYGV